jgi:hypothetical protein
LQHGQHTLEEYPHNYLNMMFVFMQPRTHVFASFNKICNILISLFSTINNGDVRSSSILDRQPLIKLGGAATERGQETLRQIPFYLPWFLSINDVK